MAWQIYRRREEGQDLVETAILLPLFLLLLFAVLEFGLLIFAYNSVAGVAREGARFGVIQLDGPGDPRTAADIRDHVMDRTTPGNVGIGHCNGNAGLDAANVVVTATLTTVSVDVTCEWGLIAGNIIDALGGTNAVPLRAVSSMRRE